MKEENSMLFFWVLLKKTIIFPNIFLLIAPLLMLISLFFVPDGYPGISKYSQTMQGTVQNKWLFDILSCYSILIFFSSITYYFMFGIPKYVSDLIIEKFLSKNKGAYNDTIIKLLPLIIFLLSLTYICFFCFFEAVNTDRNIDDFNRNVFVNFFIFYIIKCCPIILATCFFIQSMEIKKNVVQ